MAFVQTRQQTRGGRKTFRPAYREPDPVTGKLGRQQYGPTYDTPEEADAWLTRWKHDHLTGAYVSPKSGRRLFGDWWAEWSASRVNLAPSTRDRDASYAASMILPAFQAVALADLTPLVAQRWVNQLQADRKAPATVVKAAQLAGGAMRAAVRSRLIALDPFDGLDLPRIEPYDAGFLTPDQVADLADAIKPRWRGFVLVGAYCGLRLGELAGLRRRRVDLLRRRLDVIRDTTKTTAGRRMVPVPRHVADELETHLDRYVAVDGDALVFTGEKGAPIHPSNLRRRIWTPATVAAGVDPFRIHDLRHTAVALWIDAGATPSEVQHRAGVRSASFVLDRYGHRFPAGADRVNDALDAVYVGRG